MFKLDSQRVISLTIAFLTAFTVSYCENSKADEIVYQQDQYGNIRYDKPAFIIEDNGTVYERDSYGNTRYDKPSYVTEGNTTYQRDQYGNVQYHKPSLTTQGGKK